MPLHHQRKRTIGHGKNKRLKPYYTVIAHYVEHGATRFHPTTRVGPFAKLSRGMFHTASEARAWARVNLGPTGWKIKRITENTTLGVNVAKMT